MTVILDVDRAEQAQAALQVANAKRCAKARLRRDIKAGQITLAQIVATRPLELADCPLFEVLLMFPQRGQRALVEINRHAIRDRVNLAVTFGDASTTTLRWLTDLTARGSRPGRPLVVFGHYSAFDGRPQAGRGRRVVLEHGPAGTRVLRDTGVEGDVEIERFAVGAQDSEIAWVAERYLEDQREHHRALRRAA